MAGFVEATVQDLDKRIVELQDELHKLEAARTALVGPAKRGPGRPRAESAKSDATPRRRAGRPRGRRSGNTRTNQTLELIRTTPGITIPQLAARLKIQPNYLYRVVPKLVTDGLVTKDGSALTAIDDASLQSE